LKYLVEESIAGRIRDFVAGYLELDDYGVGKPNISYPVHSLYLDSDDLHTHQASVNGTKKPLQTAVALLRRQARLARVFEVKGRVDNCILKRRCGVRRDAVAPLLNGQWPAPEQFFTNEPRHFAALERFLLLMNSINARPKAHNAYLREAWVSLHDNSVRVTFDRSIRLEPHFNLSAAVPMREPIFVYSPVVILELKFTDRFPNWFNELVQRFNLMRSSAQKYSGGVLLFGENRFHERNEFEIAPFAPPVSATSAGELILAEF